MTLKLEIISFIAIVNREFSLSNELTANLEQLVESRYRELENNWMIDKNTIKICEIVLGTLLYLDNSIDVKIFVTRLYPNENEANQMLRNDENIISIFLSPILSLMVIWGNGIIGPFQSENLKLFFNHSLT